MQKKLGLVFTFAVFIFSSVSLYTKLCCKEDVINKSEVFSNCTTEHLNKNASVLSSTQERLDENVSVLSNTKEQSHTNVSVISNVFNEKKKPKIWVSIGLCFSETTTKHGKGKYPYLKTTLLSSMLWNFFFPDPNVTEIIIHLIHKEVNKTAEMESYEKKLDAIKVHYEWVPANGMDCVLKSQLIRMFAFGHPLVQPKDIVVAVDADFYLMTDKIFDPIYDNPDMMAWIYQYDKCVIKGYNFGLVCF